MMKIRKLMASDKGFTLIELMVVVLIIAILVAIAVPVFNIARRNARNRTCQANLRTLDGAIQTYMASYENYPVAMANLAPDFVKNVPSCPTGGAGAYSIIAEAGTQVSSCSTHGTLSVFVPE